MEKYNDRSCVLKQLKKRNARESSFKEIISYSNKLLESWDFLQKASIPKSLQTAMSEETISEYSKSLRQYDSLRKELVECHTKISGLAEQVLKLKDSLDEKNLLIAKQKTELEKALCDAKSSEELCKTFKADLARVKKILQDRDDEFDALNITYSSIENKKNNLEIENKKLVEQLLKFKEIERKSSSSESFESVFSLNTSTGSGKSLQKFEKPEVMHEVKFLPPKLSKGTCNSASNIALPGKVKFEFIAHDSEVNAILWFPNSSFLFTAGADRRVKLWEMCKNEVKLIKPVRDCNSSIMSLDLNSDTSLLLCASWDFASRVWTTSDFTIRHTLTGHSGKVASSKFLKDSYKIVSGSHDQTLKLWDIPRRVCTVTYESQSPVTDVLSKDSSSIISSHYDNKIRFWDMRTKVETSTLPTSGLITSLDVLSTNRDLLLTSVQGNTLKIFDLRACKEVLSMSEKNFALGCNWTRAKFSPDGKHCCSGSKNGSVFIWNASTGILVNELKAHNSNVISCSWSICGSYLATCDSDKNCIIWSK